MTATIIDLFTRREINPAAARPNAAKGAGNRKPAKRERALAMQWRINALSHKEFCQLALQETIRRCQTGDWDAPRAYERRELADVNSSLYAVLIDAASRIDNSLEYFRKCGVL